MNLSDRAWIFGRSFVSTVQPSISNPSIAFFALVLKLPLSTIMSMILLSSSVTLVPALKRYD